MDTQDEALMKELVPEVVPTENIATFKKKLMETLSRVDVLLDSIKGQCAVAVPPLPQKWARNINRIILFVNNTEVSSIPKSSLDTILDDVNDGDKKEYCQCILNHLGGSAEKEKFLIDYFHSKGVNL